MLGYQNVKIGHSMVRPADVIRDAQTNQIAGLCVAGTWENAPLGYVFISNLCVLPAYRGKGLAKFMLSQIITQSHGKAPSSNYS
jgi:ribosomal protein S18 acetylase RimI-like enzyme